MKNIVLTTVISLIYICPFAQKYTIAPRIINTIPAFGDCNVDPGLKEVILEFDQDMGEGFSIPDGKNFPKITNKPVWINKRKLSVPVQLDSSKTYKLLFNNWRLRNFKNTEGIPLDPDFLIFQTRGNYTADFSDETYQNLLNIFPLMYSYSNIKQIGWTELIEQNNLKDSRTNFEFTLKLLRVLKKAEDPHICLEYNGQKLYPHSRKLFVQNYNINEIYKALERSHISKNKTIVSGKYGDIGYIYIGSWDNSRKDEIRTAINRLKEFRSLENIIIDVRANAGGNEEYAKEFASCFIKEPMPYGLVKIYNENSGKFNIEHIKKVVPRQNGIIYDGNVYVLAGPKAMSSNEGFILMMKQVGNATVVGMKTYGSSGNPQPYKLSDEITLHLPSWIAYTLDNILIEGHGVEPDVEIINSQADFMKKDALFEEVIKIIEGN